MDTVPEITIVSLSVYVCFSVVSVVISGITDGSIISGVTTSFEIVKNLVCEIFP